MNRKVQKNSKPKQNNKIIQPKTVQPKPKKKSIELRKKSNDAELNNVGRQEQKLKVTEALVDKFSMSKVEVLVAWEKFHKKYETGEIPKEFYLEEQKVSSSD